MWTVSSSESVFEILCSKNFTAQKMFFFTFFFLIIKTNDLQCHNQSKFCPKVQFSSFSSENWQFGFNFSYMHSSQSYEASNTKSVRPWKMGANLLRCWKQFRRELLIIFNRLLKRFTSGRHKIFTTDWLWIGIFQNAVWVKLVLKWQL